MFDRDKVSTIVAKKAFKLKIRILCGQLNFRKRLLRCIVRSVVRNTAEKSKFRKEEERRI